MPLSGEAIRTMNYVDDISVTLRRILAVLPSLTEEERQRVSNTSSSRSQLRLRDRSRGKQEVTEPAPLGDGPGSLPIRTIAIIGAGQRGAASPWRLAAAGFYVVLEDVMPANLRKAEAEYADMSQRAANGAL